jgi:hypothetical protein
VTDELFRREQAKLVADLHTEMKRLREHAEKIWGTDWHEHHQPVMCPRCTLDMMLYGEAVFNVETGEHYDVPKLARRVPS